MAESEKIMYYRKLKEMKDQEQKSFDRNFNHIKEWEKIQPVYTKTGKEFKSFKKAFPDLLIEKTYGGNTEITLFYYREHGHYSDSFMIFDQSDLKELSYEKIMDAINNHIDSLKKNCDRHFKKIDFIEKHAENMISDVLDVLKEYDCYNPGQLKYFLYDCLGTSSLLFDIGESLYINKGEYSSFLKSQTLKRAQASAGFRENEILNNYDFYRIENIDGRIIITFFDSKENKTALWDDTFNKWVG